MSISPFSKHFVISLNSPAKSTPGIIPDAPLTQFAIEYISNHFSEKITVEEIARKMGYSTIYLSKTFKKDTGKSLYTYLTEYRISKSTILLKEGYNVTETIYSVGFNDCSNFICTFKKVIGVSPHKYRNSI